MTDQQPEALRLADRLTSPDAGPWDNADAAAELRRLHEVSTAQESLVEELFSRITALETANAELLEALKAADWYIGQLEPFVYGPDDDGVHEEHAKVRAAIAKHGGEA